MDKIFIEFDSALSLEERERLFRRCRRVILMVQALHYQGYQRLRILPGLSGSGSGWRMHVTDAANVLPDNCCPASEADDRVAFYASYQAKQYFGWKDTDNDGYRDLAEKFKARFPRLCKRGQGRDWPYAGWLVELIGTIDRERRLPAFYQHGEWYNAPEIPPAP